MPYRRSLMRFSKQSWDDFIAEFREAHDESLMEGVVAGCAIVAYADGEVTDEERRRMMVLVRGFEGLDAFPPERVESYFDELTQRFAMDHDQGEADALRVVARLKGEKHYPAMLVVTCCVIAAADGVFGLAERQAAISICETLDLDPDAFNLFGDR